MEIEKLKIDCIIGVDPGAAGGLAVWIPGRNVKTVKMPKDIGDLRDFFAYYGQTFHPIVFLEKLTVRPDDVIVEGDRAAMGKLYRIQKMMANFEHLKAIIETSGIPYVLVHPGKWTSGLGLRIKREHKPKESKQSRKNRYKEFAAKMYPGVNVTLWNADALNIMTFGRQALETQYDWVKANLPVREHHKLF